MIHYVVTKEHSYTMGTYLEEWAPEMDSHIDIISYEELTTRHELPADVYIFSDLERLTPDQTEMASQAWEQLSGAGDRVRLLNNPRRATRRYEVLRKLHQLGHNAFAVHRLSETRTPPKFPVFLRYEHRHTAASSPLLWSQDELDQAIVRAVVRGQQLEHLLIVEYCDTSDAKGEFRKYGAFVVGDHVIPRHLYFGREWIVKWPTRDLLGEDLIREELDYLERNPHERFIREVF